MDNVMSRSSRSRTVKVSRRRILFISSVILFICIYLGAQSNWFQKKYIYPYPYQNMIAHYARSHDLETPLVAGVIMSESKFQDEVHSDTGAIGLMQVMPETAEWIAQQIDEPSFSVEKLHDPNTNIRFGTWYLSSLQKEFCGNEVLMLAAYNAGRGNVHEWMDMYGWDMNFKDINQIPYQETREYVARVLKNKTKYRSLYQQ